MRGIRNTDRTTRKFITITDTNLWEQIERIMTLPTYEKSFNRVINDALIYGLPKLCAAEFGETQEDETATPPKSESEIIGENFLTIIRLLKEVVINENINKSIVCSLFQVRELELEGTVAGSNSAKDIFKKPLTSYRIMKYGN